VTPAASGLYAGEVVHQRFAPRRHRLKYRLFQILFDLDDLPALSRRLRLFSHNRFNAFSFHDTDHGEGADAPLRDYVDRILLEAGLDLGGGRILLLCLPRVLGWVFNPLSVYYCHDAKGDLVAMIYEVKNTFGEQHSYVIPAGEAGDGPIIQSCQKGFYVSPFMDMDMTYDFRLTRPGETVATTIYGRDGFGSPLIFAAFTGQRQALSDRVLARVLVGFPLLTLGVVAAIHWEAIILALKGLRLRIRPAPPAEPVTLVPAPLRPKGTGHGTPA
jgi:DUF1365 family protein